MGFVAAAIGIISLIQGQKAAKDAKQAGKQQGRIDQRVTQEKVFQSKLEERILAGETRSAAAGAGVTANVGSPLTILAEQARTFARDRAFISEVGAEQANLSRQRGRNVGTQARFSGYAGALSAFGQAGTAFAAGKGFGF